jgi:ubiquinone biosynthesis protein UbiJ
LAKVNYQYEKQQKELAKKRKKAQKEKLKQNKKNVAQKVTDETPEAPPSEK